MVEKTGIFSGVLLASDFDGTVYGSVTGMSPRNQQWLDYFLAEGGRFAIATGRTYVTFAPHYKILESNCPTILSNGAGVYDFQKQEQISLICLPDTAKQDLVQLCEEMPSLAVEAYYEEDIFAYRPNHITDEHMAIVGQQYQEMPLEEMPCPWLKVMLQEDRDVLLQARQRLQQIRPGSYESIFSNPRYLEVTARGVNKGSAVLKLAEEYGISQEHIYCVGDNENDLSMLSIAQIGFAPSSSAQVVLDSKPRLLCTCAEGILGDLIPLLEEIYRPQGGERG